MSQTTNKCHIIRKGYLKGFLKDGETTLHYYSLEKAYKKLELKKINGKTIKHNFKKSEIWEKRTIKKIGRNRNVYNYFDNNLKKWNADLEENLSKVENELSFILNKFINYIKNQSKYISYGASKDIFINNEYKKQLLILIQFLIYKITFYKIRKFLKNKHSNIKINKDLQSFIDFISKRINIENILKSGGYSLFNLIDRHWLFIFSEKDMFFVGDIPFNFRANRKNNTDGDNLETFFKNENSQLIFPLSKNIGLIIENPGNNVSSNCSLFKVNNKVIRKYTKLFHKKVDNGEIPNDSLEYMFSILILNNSTEYIVGPEENLIKKALKDIKSPIINRYNNSDVMKFILNEKLPSVLENIFKIYLEE